MNNVKILADSTCDLSEELIRDNDISIIPLMISLGNDTLRDGLEIRPEVIYEWSDRTGETPKTAAPTLGDAVEFLMPFVNQDKEIIFFGISEAMSATCQVIRLAAEQIAYHKIYVIDSKSLSTGIGLQVLRAAELARKGYGAEEILEDNRNINSKVRASFVIDTLTFLHRGGRCSGVAALLANTLKLKPEIVVKEGKMEVEKKYRGNSKAVLMKYCREKEASLRAADPSRVFITHSGCPIDVVEEVASFLRDLGIFGEILKTRAGSVISSHCGPNTLGILYISR